MEILEPKKYSIRNKKFTGWAHQHSGVTEKKKSVNLKIDQ